MPTTRTRRSIKNAATALIGQLLTIILNFAVRTIFIRTLGAAYLGINGLFTNILSVLSFAEIGFGTAIIYAMYAPLAVKDEIRVSKLMNYYAKVYETIGAFIFIAGLLLVPFLHFFINDLSELPAELPSLWIIYLLYLFNTSISYFFNYKRSLIIASQNGHVDSLNQLYFNSIKGILQIIVLFVFHDFLSFLIIQIVCTFFGNYFISRKADQLFPYLQRNKDQKIDKNDKDALRRNVFAMSFSKLGSVVITGVDDLLISKFVGIIAMGIYSNYLLLTNTIRIVFMQMLLPITASVGNYVAEKSDEEAHAFFKKLFFINAYFAICCFIALSTLVNPFINLIWGKEYVFSAWITFLITFNFYLDRMRTTSQIFIDAKGLFWPIKWKSLFEAVINLSFSFYFLLVLKWGIESIITATIISNLTTNIWWEPYVVFKYGFQKKVVTYYLMIVKYTIRLAVSYLTANYLQSFFSAGFTGFLSKAIIALLVPNIIMLLFYFKTDELKYFVGLIKNIINKKL
jgi:O-antigen/teichoic acid export membrane protein